MCLVYRTTSYDAATLLARTPPLELMAVERTSIYRRIREAGGRASIPNEEMNRIRFEEKTILARIWTERLEDVGKKDH